MKLMTPIAYYEEQCKRGTVTADPEQRKVLDQLEKTFFALVAEHHKRFGWQRLLHRAQWVQGDYIWGGVGIGKTFLMDCFYNCLPFKQKMRVHFHQFMRRVHHDLQLHQGKADPLHIIAKELARETMVICFDEFFVSDITDAMLLGRLLTAMVYQKVTLVATSNIAPDELYKNGLQRLQFLPAIALIKKYLDVVPVSSKIDYRLRHLQEAGIFYTPLDAVAQKNMLATFEVLSRGQVITETPIELNGRLVPVKKKSADIIWFNFADICQIPRSQNDFLVIAEQYRTVFISDVPAIPPEATDTICLFISLVDVFYDARIKLVMSAAEPVPELYNKGFKVLEYTRTHSRLLEMQSLDYFLND